MIVKEIDIEDIPSRCKRSPGSCAWIPVMEDFDKSEATALEIVEDENGCKLQRMDKDELAKLRLRVHNAISRRKELKHIKVRTRGKRMFLVKED